MNAAFRYRINTTNSRHEDHVPSPALERRSTGVEVVEVNHLLLQLLCSRQVALGRDPAAVLSDTGERRGLEELAEKVLPCCARCADYESGQSWGKAHWSGWYRDAQEI